MILAAVRLAPALRKIFDPVLENNIEFKSSH